MEVELIGVEEGVIRLEVELIGVEEGVMGVDVSGAEDMGLDCKVEEGIGGMEGTVWTIV